MIYGKLEIRRDGTLTFRSRLFFDTYGMKNIIKRIRFWLFVLTTAVIFRNIHSDVTFQY